MDPSDPDDWFADADAVPEDVRRPDAASEDSVHPWEDDWLGEAEVVSRRPSWPEAIDRRVLVIVASLLVLLIAGLAAGGVFSGGRGGPNASTLTTATVPTTAQSPTTATTTARQIPVPATTLKPGDTGTQVVTLQRALTSLGFSPGKADGRYGPATTAAVMRFQRKDGLTTDGIVGGVTLHALVRALRGQ